MSDSRLRRLERLALANPGDFGARLAFLTEKGRKGDAAAGREAKVLQGMNPVADFASKLVESARTEGRGMSHRIFFAVKFPDGTSLSVQAGQSQYSAPRRLLPLGDHSYTEWELGATPNELPHQVAASVDWEGGYDHETDEYVSGPDYAGFTVAPYVETEVVQAMLTGLYVALGDPTFDGSGPDRPDPDSSGESEAPAEPVNPHADNVVDFSENNSGGSWWLGQDQYKALIEAGWEAGRTSYDGSIRGATRRGLSEEDAIAEWERITGADANARGCDCCGQPFSFY